VALSAGSKQPGCEADHSLQFNTKFKSGWNYTVFPPCAFTVCTWTTSLASSCILAVHVTTYSLGTERHCQRKQLLYTALVLLNGAHACWNIKDRFCLMLLKGKVTQYSNCTVVFLTLSLEKGGIIVK